jgi:hypothetical protein
MKFIIAFIYYSICIVSVSAQSVNIDSIKIDNGILMKISLEKLKRLHAIDSVVPVPRSMEVSVADSLIYIGSSYFHYDKITGICEPGKIVFDDKIKFLSISSHKLSKETTFEEIKKMFPTDCSIIYPIDISQDAAKYMTCGIWTTNSYGHRLDIKLLFIFSENKLKRIDFWQPS